MEFAMKNPFLVGSKIYLRPLESADAGAVAPWFNAPEVRQYLSRYRPMNVHAEVAFLEKSSRSEKEVLLGIVVSEGDVLIGCAGLHPIDWKNRHSGFGIVIGEPAHWEKGYGTEATALMAGYAFESLNLNRVWLRVYEDNPRALRAYEKIGFRREAILRQDNYRHGRYWDTILMAMLHEEWTERKQSEESRA
jgi:RimJ/RimL family protein N-acetyltransferase